MPLPRIKPYQSFLALALLAICLALLASFSMKEALKWINWKPSATSSGGQSSSGATNNSTTAPPQDSSSSHNSYSYSSEELQFQRQLDRENDHATTSPTISSSRDGDDDDTFDESSYFPSDYSRTKPVCPVGLPLGDINILVVTDIHGWIAGQHARHEPHWDVDMGDLVSFYQQLQWQQHPPWYAKIVTRPTGCPPRGDWFLLFNGDMMDGTGLSTIPPDHMAPLLQQVPFSALNVGNHELYHNEVADYMMNQGFIRHWQGNYLASNVDYILPPEPQQQQQDSISTIPFGNRYTFLHGPVLNSTILTFGFLYNFVNNCNHTLVRTVEDTLQEDWFVDVLTKPPQPYDAIIVMGHMDAVDPLVYKILDAIRGRVGDDMPIQFLTGHSHRRHFEVLDPLATSLEAGRFMDTIGFASFPLKSTTDYILKKPGGLDRNTQQAASLFQHEFLDANYKVLGSDVLGMPGDFSTLKGKALSFNLKETQKRMGLLDVVAGCAPQDYGLAKPLNDTDSLWWLYMEQVIPTTFFPMLEASDAIPIFIQGTGGLRYSLFSPTVVVDDIIAVTPFENPIYQVASRLSAQELLQVLDGLHVDDVSPQWPTVGLPNFGVAGPRPSRHDRHNKNTRYNLYTVAFHATQTCAQVQNATKNDKNSKPCKPRPIYETIQDDTNDPKQLGTTKIWMDFVGNQWKCPDDDANNFSERRLGWHKFVSLPYLLAIASLAALVLLALVVRRPHSPSKTKEKFVAECVSETSPLLSDTASKASTKSDYKGV